MDEHISPASYWLTGLRLWPQALLCNITTVSLSCQLLLACIIYLPEKKTRTKLQASNSALRCICEIKKLRHRKSILSKLILLFLLLYYIVVILLINFNFSNFKSFSKLNPIVFIYCLSCYPLSSIFLLILPFLLLFLLMPFNLIKYWH